MERIMYYFIKGKNDKNDNTKIIMSENFLGDINDVINYQGSEYIIIDYTEEVR